MKKKAVTQNTTNNTSTPANTNLQSKLDSVMESQIAKIMKNNPEINNLASLSEVNTAISKKLDELKSALNTFIGAQQ